MHFDREADDSFTQWIVSTIKSHDPHCLAASLLMGCRERVIVLVETLRSMSLLSPIVSG